MPVPDYIRPTYSPSPNNIRPKSTHKARKAKPLKPVENVEPKAQRPKVPSRRNPKRNVAEVNYFEPEEPGEDRYVFCDNCEEEYLDYCSKCGMLKTLRDFPVPLGTEDRAKKTAPKYVLEVHPSNIHGLGVFAIMDVRKGIQMGPYQGKITRINSTNGYCWKLRDGRLAIVMTLLTDNPVYDLFLFVTALLVVIFSYFHHSYQYWKNRNFPYLTPKFPLGNSPNLFSSSLGFGLDTVKYYDELKKKGLKFGGIYTITSPALVLVDPDYVRDILSKDFHYFIDRGHYYNEKKDPISAHLFALDESKWKNMRTKLTPTFTSGKMKMMFNSILDISRYMTDAIEKCALERKDIDLREFLSCFTTDVIGSCAFGIECNSFKGTEAEFRHMGREIFAVRGARIFTLILISKMPKLALKLGLKGTNDHVSKFFYDAVQKTIKYREDNHITRPDFLQLLIDIKNQTKDSENPFTMDQLVSQVFLFFLAGFDTSSATMNFTLYELCKHQDVQDKVREEINEVLERHNGQLTYESLGELKYLQQAIDEAQRLYPPVVVLTRVCVKDYKLKDTDLVVERGTRVVIPLYSIQRDPEYYPEPDKFDPERFSSENKKSRHPFVHMPFGEGPRNCIGLRFGLMQSKIGLATILSKFRLKISPKTDMPLRLDESVLLVKSINTLYVTAEKI